jgi:hypothetical protein
MNDGPQSARSCTMNALDTTKSISESSTQLLRGTPRRVGTESLGPQTTQEKNARSAQDLMEHHDSVLLTSLTRVPLRYTH